MALDITQEELRELAILVAPLIKSNATDVGTTPFVDSLDGISSLPAVHRVNGITKIVRAAISKLKGDKGDDGRALEFIIIDSFDTYEELVTAYPEGPERNGFFKVGESLYIWVNGKYEYLNFDVFRSFAKEQFIEVVPAGNEIIISHTRIPYAKVTLFGDPEVFDITINNTKDGSVGKILLSQTGNKRIYFTSFDVIGDVDLPTDSGSIILITYNRVGDKIYIHSDIVLGGSNPTFGKLRNVDQSVDAAPVGSFPVKGEDKWTSVAPVKSEQADMTNLLVPVWHTTLKAWVFVSANNFGGATPPTPSDTFTISTGFWEGGTGWGTIIPLGETKVNKGDSLTVQIQANEGYEVSRANVDGVAQGAITSYTFEDIQSDHSVYAWFKAAEVIEPEPTDYLIRSDSMKAYSSLHSVLEDIKNDYPSGLTKDVTVTCLVEATEKRDTSLGTFGIFLKDFNKGSAYTLTIDGAGKYTLNGRSLGIMRFENVDNVIVKGITFANFSNMAEFSTPEEMAAITILGKDDDYCSNLYIDNCTFNGINGEKESWYSIIAKNLNGLYITDCTFRNNACYVFKLNAVNITSLIKNDIGGKQRSGIIGHPGMMSTSAGQVLILEDNDIDGTSFNETLFYTNSLQYVHVRRNVIHDASGRFIELGSITSIKEVVFESNRINNMILSPVYDWIKNIVSLTGDIDSLKVINNTVLLNSTYYYQSFIVGNYVKELFSCNNIFITSSAASCTLFEVSKLDMLKSNNNLFKCKVKESNSELSANTSFFTTGDDSIVSIKNPNNRNIAKIKELGYETESTLVGAEIRILKNENDGEAGYGLIDSIANNYPAKGNTALFDIDYKKNVYLGTIGAYNHNGVIVNEAADTTSGYTGKNVTAAESFSHTARYDTPSGFSLLLSHNTLNRSRLVRWKISGSKDTVILLGRYGILNPVCVTDENGEYSSDQLFNIEIE